MAGLEGLFNLVFVDMGAGGLTVIVFQLLIGSASCGGVQLLPVSWPVILLVLVVCGCCGLFCFLQAFHLSLVQRVGSVVEV